MSRLSIMARVAKCGKSLRQMDAGLVWLLAAELGVRLHVTDDGRLVVDGPRDALTFLAPGLRFHKATLLRGRCQRCPNLAETTRGLCLWCAELPPRVYVYEPNSLAERSYLAALEAAHRPNDPHLREAA